MPKSIQVVSASGGHTQPSIDLLKVLHFIQETMQTFTNYSEQLKINLNINVTHQETSYIYQRIRFLLILIDYTKILILYPLQKDIMKSSCLHICKISF